MWQWMCATDGFWHLYEAQAQQMLCSAKQNGASSVVMFIEGHCTVVNLKAMVHVDSLSGYSCKIRFLPAMKASMLPMGYGSLPNCYNAFVPDVADMTSLAAPMTGIAVPATGSGVEGSRGEENFLIPAIPTTTTTTTLTTLEVPSSLYAQPPSSRMPADNASAASPPPLPQPPQPTTAPVNSQITIPTTCDSTVSLPSGSTQLSNLTDFSLQSISLRPVRICEEALAEVPLMPALTRMAEWLRGIQSVEVEVEGFLEDLDEKQHEHLTDNTRWRTTDACPVGVQSF